VVLSTVGVPLLFIAHNDMDTVQVTPLMTTSIFFRNRNALAAISKGMRTLKLCSNKILQFLTGVTVNARCPVEWL